MLEIAHAAIAIHPRRLSVCFLSLLLLSSFLCTSQAEAIAGNELGGSIVEAGVPSVGLDIYSSDSNFIALLTAGEEDAPTAKKLMSKALELRRSLEYIQGLVGKSSATPKGANTSKLLSIALSVGRNVSDELIKRLTDKVCWNYPSHRFGKNPAKELDEQGNHEPMLGWTPMRCWTNLGHPFLWLYVTHLLVALGTTVLAFHAPKVLIGVMLVSGLLWPFSALIRIFGGNGDIWETQPLTSGEWYMTFAKWAIVNAAAAVPVLVVKEYDVSYVFVQRVGDFIYFILGMNIVWTLFFKVNGWVRLTNFAVGSVLTIALGFEVAALKRANKPLLDKINGIPYGRATPLLWLVSYTIWNATFVGDLSIGMTLQDCLFWAMMYMMQWVDPCALTIDLYFAFARPLQLGVYIALGCWTGIIPWFRNAETYEPVPPLGINDDCYFFFITVANLLISFVVLAQAVLEFQFGVQSRLPHRTLSMVEQGNDLSSRGSVLIRQSRHTSVPMGSFSFSSSTGDSSGGTSRRRPSDAEGFELPQRSLEPAVPLPKLSEGDGVGVGSARPSATEVEADGAGTHDAERRDSSASAGAPVFTGPASTPP